MDSVGSEMACRICVDKDLMAARERLIWEALATENGLQELASGVNPLLAGIGAEEMYRHYRYHQTQSPVKRSERLFVAELLDDYYLLPERHQQIIEFVSKARVCSPRGILEVFYPTDKLTAGKLDRVGRELKKLAVAGWLGRYTARGKRPVWSVIHGRNLYTLGPKGAAVLEHLTGRWRPYHIDPLTLHHDLEAAWIWIMIHKSLHGQSRKWGPWNGEVVVPVSSYDGTITIGYWDGNKVRDQLPDGIGQVVWRGREYWMPACDPRLMASGKKAGVEEVKIAYNYPHPRVWNAYPERPVDVLKTAPAKVDREGLLPAPLRSQVGLPFFIEYDNGTKPIETVAQQLLGYYHMRESVGRVFPQLRAAHGTEYGEEMGLPVFMIMNDTNRVNALRQEMIQIAPNGLELASEMEASIPGIWLTTLDLFERSLTGEKVIIHAFSDMPAYDFWHALISSSTRALQSPFMNGNDLLIDRKQARRISGGKGFVHKA